MSAEKFLHTCQRWRERSGAGSFPLDVVGRLVAQGDGDAALGWLLDARISSHHRHQS
jgi:hypothetical protein